MKYAIGKLQITKDEDSGELKTPRITKFIPSNSKEDEVRIKKLLNRQGFKPGKPFKNEKTGQVLVPGTFWVNEGTLNGNEINKEIYTALNNKNVFFDNGYMKSARKAYFKVGNSTIFNIRNVEDKDVVRICGNLRVVEKAGKKSLFISNSVLLVNKDGEEWKEETINTTLKKLTAFGLYATVNEVEGKKYLNISKSIYAAKTSMFDEELLSKVQKESPFVVIETSFLKHLEGGSFLIDYRNKITPLGEKSKKVFSGYEDKMSMIEKSNQEDLYGIETNQESSEVSTDNIPEEPEF